MNPAYFRALLVTALLFLIGLFASSCADQDELLVPGLAGAETRSFTAYEHAVGYCGDTDELGVPYSPARPLWSSLSGNHYDAITWPDGQASIRYPDYEDISHNLAIDQTLQFLLSMFSNITGKLEDAGEYIESGAYVDAVLVESFPQTDGHCICLNGACDPQTVFSDVEAAVNEMIEDFDIADFILDFIADKLDVTQADLAGLDSFMGGLIDPGDGIAGILGAALFDAVDDVINDAIANFDPAITACNPGTLDPTILADAIEAAVLTQLAVLQAELQADFAAIQALITNAITLGVGTFDMVREDLLEVWSYFDEVEGFADLISLDWATLIAAIEDMVPEYEAVVDDITAAIEDATAIWDNVSNYGMRIQELGDALYADILAAMDLYDTDVQACLTAIQDAASYIGAFSPADFTDDLTDALKDAANDVWDAAQMEVMASWQNIQDRINGVGDDPLGTIATAAGDIVLLVTGDMLSCYQRGPRPDCFDFCGASSATAQEDFLWMPVDFLQSPEAFAAGVASGAMFALGQTGWLDQIVEWIDNSMGTVLGDAIGTALSVIADVTEAVEAAQEFLGDLLEYVDRFTEGYHLGAYSELRPDLHMCVGYAGHGAYAQMGGLGGDNFSIGARYSSHNLSAQNRIQFRSGGFGVSAFGYDLSLAPGIEFNTQINGWRMWDQTAPFGIPINVSLNADAVGRLDVFNVVPMDEYPFGYSENIPVGSFIVRDLFPSRVNPGAADDWPRPGVGAEWEDESTAVISLGLNLPFDFGPYQLNLPTITIYPGVTITPFFRYAFGLGWIHDTNYMRHRVQDMINENLPTADQLDESDFNRDMHAM